LAGRPGLDLGRVVLGGGASGDGSLDGVAEAAGAAGDGAAGGGLGAVA
jgi:hypothetical protein